ncbi:MAG: hypothetical protein V3R47_03185, partial [candidate division NC10 bacterium]
EWIASVEPRLGFLGRQASNARFFHAGTLASDHSVVNNLYGTVPSRVESMAVVAKTADAGIDAALAL